MNPKYKPLLRPLMMAILAIILMRWSNASLIYLIMLIGCCLLVPSIINILLYMRERKSGKRGKQNYSIRVDTIGSLLMGATLIALPHVYLRIFVYLLGFLLILAGVYQIFLFLSMPERNRVPLGFYLLPAVVTLSGITVMVNPFKTVDTVLYIFAVALLVYAVTDVIAFFRYPHKNIQ